MKTTTASGAVLARLLRDSAPQSSRSDFEMPVPMCGSRIVSTPRDARTPGDLGVERHRQESPVTSSVRSGRRGTGDPSARGSNASGVTGGTPPAATLSARLESRPPAPRVSAREAPSHQRSRRTASPEAVRQLRRRARPVTEHQRAPPAGLASPHPSGAASGPRRGPAAASGTAPMDDRVGAAVSGRPSAERGSKLSRTCVNRGRQLPVEPRTGSR